MSPSTQLPPTSAILHGQEVNIAPLETIDFARLAAKDPLEVSRLLRCCVTHGFFYLDLQGNDPARQVISDEKDVLRFMESYFDQPLEVKMKDDRASYTHG
jgi:isopenicillin N synthase-like dioxygenase